jgi:hypothetical protein
VTTDTPTRTTIALIGAGPGTGAAAARRLGRESLEEQGTPVRGFAADVPNAESVGELPIKVLLQP